MTFLNPSPPPLPAGRKALPKGGEVFPPLAKGDLLKERLMSKSKLINSELCTGNSCLRAETAHFGVQA